MPQNAQFCAVAFEIHYVVAQTLSGKRINYLYFGTKNDFLLPNQIWELLRQLQNILALKSSNEIYLHPSPKKVSSNWQKNNLETLLQKQKTFFYCFLEATLCMGCYSKDVQSCWHSAGVRNSREHSSFCKDLILVLSMLHNRLSRFGNILSLTSHHV